MNKDVSEYKSVLALIFYNAAIKCYLCRLFGGYHTLF